MSSSSPKLFITGATGYVGGDALFLLLSTHPTWHYTLLVRDRSRVDSLAIKYPNLRIVIGDLSDTSLIAQEAVAADIILTFASSDDVASAKAVASAIRGDSKTRFWIHTSGTANLLHDDVKRGVPLGELSPRIWDDLADSEAINAWSENVYHRPVEKIVLEAGIDRSNVRSAVVCPPVILGVGRGPGNQRSIQVPILVELIRRRGRAFRVGQGKARWGFVHIHDLSDLYLLITEAAAADDGRMDWGREGWYFAENGEMEWGAVSTRIAQRLHAAGELPTAEVDSLNAAEASKLFGRLGAGSVGANSRSRARRPRKRLGWSPKRSNLDELVDEAVSVDLRSVQSRLDDFSQGHMPKASKSGRFKL